MDTSLHMPAESMPLGIGDSVPTSVNQKIGRVLACIRQFEMPLLDALEAEYDPEGRWPRVCGPAAIVLGHLISDTLDIPFQPLGDRDHHTEQLGIHISVFNARHKPELPPSIDHSTLVYDTGDGTTLSIEPIADMLWHGKLKTPGVIRTQVHRQGTLSKDLQQSFHLYPAAQEVRDYPGRTDPMPDLFGRGEPSTYADYLDVVDLMHSHQVYGSAALLLSGKTLHIDGSLGGRLTRVRAATLAALKP